MGDLRAKVAYLEGLAEGLGMEAESREGRLMAHMIDVMGEIAEAVEDLSEVTEDLADYVQEVDDDLTDALDYEDADALEDDDDDQEVVLCCPDCGSEMEIAGIDIQATNSSESMTVE